MRTYLCCMTVIILTVLMVVCLLGCHADTTARYFSYLDLPAQVSLTGRVDGLDFSATLYSHGRGTKAAPNEGKRELPSLSMTFTAPSSLTGLTLTYTAETGAWQLSFDGLNGETDEKGLGAIVSVLMKERAIQTTTRKSGTILLTLTDGTHLTLDEQTGLPQRAVLAVDGRAIEVTVVHWEADERGK
jgi:hypothetical protein